jgi:hypothetical protein
LSCTLSLTENWTRRIRRLASCTSGDANVVPAEKSEIDEAEIQAFRHRVAAPVVLRHRIG